MLKVRYETKTGLLSGWTDIEEEFDDLQSRTGEDTEILVIPKPDNDDYENFIYLDGALLPSGKPEPMPRPEPETVRGYGAEINEINAKIADYDELRARVEKLEKK